MIIWKRFGALVFLSIALAMFTFFTLNEKLYGKNFDHMNSLIMYLFWLPAFYNFILEKIFCRNEKEETLYNSKNEPVKVNNYSSFFFIRNKYWTYILFFMYLAGAITLNFKK